MTGGRAQLKTSTRWEGVQGMGAVGAVGVECPELVSSAAIATSRGRVIVGRARLGEGGWMSDAVSKLPSALAKGGAWTESKAVAWLWVRLARAASMPASEYDWEGVSAGP